VQKNTHITDAKLSSCMIVLPHNYNVYCLFKKLSHFTAQQFAVPSQNKPCHKLSRILKVPASSSLEEIQLDLIMIAGQQFHDQFYNLAT
jgi:hypothetical protein